MASSVSHFKAAYTVLPCHAQFDMISNSYPVLILRLTCALFYLIRKQIGGIRANHRKCLCTVMSASYGPLLTSSKTSCENVVKMGMIVLGKFKIWNI
jgi:hypothetical protein